LNGTTFLRPLEVSSVLSDVFSGLRITH